MKSLDNQALLELNAPSIKHAAECWLNKLSSHCFDHEEFQSDDQNVDENETVKAV